MKKSKLFFSVIILFGLIGIFFYFYFYKEQNFSFMTNFVQKDTTIFANYMKEAENKLKELSLDEKIAQLLLVRHPINNQIAIQQKYQFGGYIFFGRDFQNKTKEEVINMITSLQEVSNIPILTAIDEEGGIVSRISSNKNLVATPFKSPQDLYKENGFEAIYDDVINKSKILEELHLNLNLAPVVDVSTNPSDYIYKRTLGMDTEQTSIYAKTVISASKEGNVSYTLKHFPGYGNNLDTHQGESIDNKTLDDKWKYDLPPFIEGIKAGAEAIMVSHNIVTSMDSENPSSISLKVHEFLINDLNYSGIIITDDISMGALINIEDVEIKAIKAKNNILITSDYEKSFNNIKKGIEENIITEEEIDELVTKVLAWKYYKKLL